MFKICTVSGFQEEPYMTLTAVPQDVLAAFDFPSHIRNVERYGHGHINVTYRVTCNDTRYILQGISSAAFPHPEQLMENIAGITAFLRTKIAAAGGDPDRETLTLLPTHEGKNFYTDSTGNVWRLVKFIEGTTCAQTATPELFEATGYSFGRFQRMLEGYPVESLHETICRFHDTEDRYAKFEAALAADSMGRAAGVAEEIAFVQARKADCSVAMQALREGKLPLRVTHNDTKLNNILFDASTGKGLCVIDLDTTMAGLSINDFGDAIRYGASTAAEDEKDLSKVHFDLGLYETFTRGFLEGAQGALTDAELEYLPWGAKLMTLECGMRFLTDYLDGDHYFRIAYPEHNLDRCRTQFKLVTEMEAAFGQMYAVIEKYR